MEELEPRSYAYYRNLLDSGWFVLWRGKGILSWLILRFSAFSHASLVLRLDHYGPHFDRILIEEALAHGSSLRFLSKRIEDYSGEVYLFKPEGLTTEIQNKLVWRALTDVAIGVKYDFKSLFKNILGRVSKNAKRFFCSEEVDDIVTSAGLKRKPEHRNKKAPRPGDLPVWYEGTLLRVK